MTKTRSGPVADQTAVVRKVAGKIHDRNRKMPRRRNEPCTTADEGCIGGDYDRVNPAFGKGSEGRVNLASATRPPRRREGYAGARADF
jgi:hypothetical protein